MEMLSLLPLANPAARKTKLRLAYKALRKGPIESSKVGFQRA